MASKVLKPVGKPQPETDEIAEPQLDVTPRLSPDELRRLAGADERQPPAVMPRRVRTIMVNFRLTERLANALSSEATKAKTTQKVIVTRALAAAGLSVPPEDLEDRTPRRRRRRNA